MGIEEIRRIKEAAGQPKNKPAYSIPKQSDKKKKQIAEEKKERGDNDTLKENWFKARRKQMVGVCQCGCAKPSSKKDDTFFRNSLAHIFPKSKFESIMYHPLNFVERAFFGGCHTNMDEQGMDKWPNMADWEDIKEKFYVLAPLLTDEERAMKFYTKLEKLVYDDEPTEEIIKSENMTQEEILQLTSKQHVKIFKLSELGIPVKEIARLLGTNTGNVYNVIKDYRVHPEKAALANA